MLLTYRNIVTQVFLRLEKRDVKIWIKGKYLGGGNFGKVIYMYTIMKRILERIQGLLLRVEIRIILYIDIFLAQDTMVLRMSVYS